MKFLIVLLALVITSLTGFSQVPGKMNGHQMAQKDTEMMVQQLQLDTLQKSKITTINYHFFEALTAVGSAPEQLQIRKQKIETLNRERMEAFKKVLTPQQLVKYQADMEAMRQQMQKKNAELSKKHLAVRPQQDSAATKH